MRATFLSHSVLLFDDLESIRSWNLLQFISDVTAEDPTSSTTVPQALKSIRPDSVAVKIRSSKWNLGPPDVNTRLENTRKAAKNPEPAA